MGEGKGNLSILFNAIKTFYFRALPNTKKYSVNIC